MITNAKNNNKAKGTRKKPKPTVENPSLTLKVGEKDKYGWTLKVRQKVEKRFLDIWESPMARKYMVAYPVTDVKGEVVGKTKTFDEATDLLEKTIIKEQVIAEIHVVPLGTETASLSHYVAACLEILKEAEDITYRLTAMGTIVQGPLDKILELARKMHESPFTMGVKRVATTIYIDDRRDKLITIEGKIKSVLDKSPQKG